MAESKKTAKKEVQEIPTGNATGLRIGAVILWVVAIGCEVLALLTAIGKLFTGLSSTMRIVVMIGFLVLDLVALIIGSQLWKKSNKIDPASEKNKVKFWLWNNMGVIVCVICFLPIIILLLTNKDLDKKTKTIAVVVAIIALLIGGVASYDWNPVSAEQQEAAITALGTDDVYWTRFGHVYHTHDDCQALNQSEELTYGTVEQAIAANRARLCSFGAKRVAIAGVDTDEVDTSALEEAVEAPAA